MKTLLITLVLVTAGPCVGLWWYLRLRRSNTRGLETSEDTGRTSWPGSDELREQESDQKIDRKDRSALPTPPDGVLVDTNAPIPTLVIPESATFGSLEDAFPIKNEAQEHIAQSFSDSKLSAEDIIKVTSTSAQGDRHSETHVESKFSKANRGLGSVSPQKTSAHLASDSDVPPSVQLSATGSLEPIDQFTFSGKTAERIGEPAATGTELDESDASAETSQEQKSNRAVSVLDERSANETETLRPSREEPANDPEPSIVLSDLGGEDITTIANEQTQPVPVYRPLAPAAATVPTRPRRSTATASSPTSAADLRLKLQLFFGRGGDVKLNLVADRREHMPDEIEVSFTQGKLLLIRHRKDCYEPVSLSEASNALHEGVEWRGRNDSFHFRWMLSRRELHVLAEGDVSGLYPFGSTARLQLNARHVVIATLSLRDDVLAALSEVGCSTLEIYDETTPGVPAGWLLFRNVVPTNAVPMRDGADILNALCPIPDVEPHFVGGIHLERDTWLLGHPPHIRLTGDLNGVEIKIDGQPVIVGSDGSASAPDWDVEGDHRLWFGGQTRIYSLRTIEENWQRWPAIDFRMGATICGASIESSHGSWGSNQIRVPATNPLLIGARPGEVFHFYRPDDVRAQTFLACTPFQPVWALPSDPAHANRATARILLLQSAEPIFPEGLRRVDDFRSIPELQRWFSVLNAASKKQLRIEPRNEDAAALWLRYRALAKQIRRKLR